jgi:hypothetical protein
MTPANDEAALNVAFLHLVRHGDAWIIANDRVRKMRGRQWVFEAEAYSPPTPPCAPSHKR